MLNSGGFGNLGSVLGRTIMLQPDTIRHPPLFGGLVPLILVIAQKLFI